MKGDDGRVDATAAGETRTADLEQRVLERTAALEEERARLAAVVANMPAGLLIADPSGEILVANDQALSILRVDELSRQTWAWESYDTEGRPYEEGEWPLVRTLATGEIVRNERVELVAGDRSRVVIDVSTAPIRDVNGRELGAVGLFQDVTIRERQERAERDFVTNAAHQLQSPLAAIVSAIEVLQAGAKEGPERDVFLGHIERESSRLARLARALLILARAETGTEAPRDELVLLEPLLAGTAAALRPADGVAVEVSCARDLAVVTNRELLEQAVLNVAENAAKHTTAGRVELTARALDECAEISIVDTGEGIAARDRPRVFRRFYRSGENGVAGFGLGLAIVRAAVEALGGEVDLDSTAGAGTSVRLRIPRVASLVQP